MQQETYVIIMAGGVGSRFWPMSREAFPKQFHDVLGVGKTMIQQTYERFKSICPPENYLVVTNEQYRELVQEQLPEIGDDQILGEPSRRNTAPCIAYACHKIKKQTDKANIIVAASDHLVMKEDVFLNVIDLALKQAEASNTLLTIGIEPSRPDTGYGYIQFEEGEKSIDPKVKKVKTFTEKPNLELANKFLESGDFYWNSGMFVWSLESILKAFEAHLPELNQQFAEKANELNTANEKTAIATIYSTCSNISVDYGIMEKAENVMVVLAEDFGWSDLGTWGSLYSNLEKDENDNAVMAKNVMLYDTKNAMIKMPEGKLLVAQGLDDFIVVDTEDALLILKKSEQQKIKQFVTDIKASGNGEDYT